MDTIFIRTEEKISYNTRINIHVKCIIPTDFYNYALQILTLHTESVHEVEL